MDELLAEVIDAHGGMDRWNGYHKAEASIVTGGGLFPLKGLIQDPDPRRMTVWLHEQRASVQPYGAPDQRTMFTPDRIAIEKTDGTVVVQRFAPSDSFAGHQMNTPWDRLHRAYFNGEFPGSVETDSRVQDFFFDDRRMLRRHDYQVNIAGGFPAAQLTSKYVRADGISLPTRRRAYTRGPDRRPVLDMAMVTIDFSDVKFS